MNCKLKQPISL